MEWRSSPVKVKNIKDHEKSESLQREKADPFLRNGNQTSAFSVRALGVSRQKSGIFKVLKLDFYPGKLLFTCECEIKDHNKNSES